MSCASSGFGSSRASSQTESAGRGSACNGCAGQKGTNVHGCEWIPNGCARICMTVNSASEDCGHFMTLPDSALQYLSLYHWHLWFLLRKVSMECCSLQRVTGRREQLQSDSQPLTIFNPTWLLEMDQNSVNQRPEAYITTLIPNGSGMISKPILPRPVGQFPLLAAQAHLPGQLHTTYGCKYMQHQGFD